VLTGRNRKPYDGAVFWMSNDDMNANIGHKPAHSRCAIQSRQRELERLRRMSIEERIRSALTMGKRFAWIRPVAGGQRP